MPNAAIAAQTYNGLTSPADPIGAFVAGASLRAKMKQLDLAAQNDVFQSTLSSLKLANDREELRQRSAFQEQSLRIAEFNAQTGRMNAQRALQKSTAGAGGANIFSAMGVDEEGNVYLDPTKLGGGQQTAQTDEYQGPTSGEGDITNGSEEVTPLTPSPATPSVLPTGGQAAAPPPDMTLPTMPGAAPRTAPTAPGGKKPGRMYLSSIGVNAKGQPSLSFKPTDPKDIAGPQVTPQILEGLNKQYEHLGVMAVPSSGDTKKGVTEYHFVERPNLKGGDFSIASLSGDVQKSFLDDVDTIRSLSIQRQEPGDAEKMIAAGVDPNLVKKDPGAAAKKMTPQMWDAGYANAKKQSEAELIAKASEHAQKLNRLFAGRPGYVPRTGLTVLNELGISDLQPQPAAPVPAAPPAPAVPLTQAPAAAMKTAPAPAAGATSQVTALQQEIAALPPGKERSQKEAFLQTLQKTQAKTSAPADPAPKVDDSDPWAMPAKQPAAPEPASPKVQAANLQWENTKGALMRGLKTTLTQEQIQDLVTNDLPSDPDRPEQGNSTVEKQSAWIRQHGKELGLKDKNGNPAKYDSVMFTDHEGRDIRLGEIFSALAKDPRFKQGFDSKGTASTGRSFSVSVGELKEVK